MSLVIQGLTADNKRICNLLLNFNELGARSDHTIKDYSSLENLELFLSNKYYTAQLRVTLKDFDEPIPVEDENDGIEGFILIPSTKMIDLTSNYYAYSKSIVEANVGLRMLVVFSTIEGGQIESNLLEQYQDWSLDNNFELIIINSDNIMEGKELREKSGLPRLMEALESNMWSTMKRQKQPSVSKPVDVVSSSSYVPPVPTITETAPAPTTVFSELVNSANKTEDVEANKEPLVESETATEKDKIESDLLFNALNSSLPEDKNYESFDQLSSLIEQAKNFRQKASSGSMSDADRRAQAAQLAIQLSAMMSLGDESDSEDDI